MVFKRKDKQREKTRTVLTRGIFLKATEIKTCALLFPVINEELCNWLREDYMHKVGSQVGDIGRLRVWKALNARQ